EQVTTQTRRMLADPRARAKMRAFFHHWLQMDRVENLSKDEGLFPGFSPQIISDLRTSLNLFLDDVLWSDASVGPPLPTDGRGIGGEGVADYRNLLLADYMFLNNRLAEFYGVSTNSTDDFVKV